MPTPQHPTGENLPILVTAAAYEVIACRAAIRYTLARLQQIENASPHLDHAFVDIKRALCSAVGIAPVVAEDLTDDDPFTEAEE